MSLQSASITRLPNIQCEDKVANLGKTVGGGGGYR